MLRNALRVAANLIAFEIAKDLIIERIPDKHYFQLALGFPFGLFGMSVVEPLVDTIVRRVWREDLEISLRDLTSRSMELPRQLAINNHQVVHWRGHVATGPPFPLNNDTAESS